MVEVLHIAKAYHLPIAPAETPKAGEGALFYETHLHRWLAAGALLILGLVFAKVSRRPAAETLPILTLPINENAASQKAA